MNNTQEKNLKKKRTKQKKGKRNKNKSKKKGAAEEVVILPYNLDAEVNRLWLEWESALAKGEGDVVSATGQDEKQPLGVQGLLDQLVAAHPDCPAPLKRQVRAAKHVIPYRHVRLIDDADGNLDDTSKQKIQELEKDEDFCRFVQQTLEQRSNFKAVKRWEDVSELTERLQATMGIVLDDNHKTWRISRVSSSPQNSDDDDDEDDERKANSQHLENKTGVTCNLCDRTFGSKNLLFRHLRDVTSNCGNTILGRGESLAEPPSMVKKQQSQQQTDDSQASSAPNKRKRSKMTPATGATIRHEAPPEACVWMGDLPLAWSKPNAGQYKHLKALLFRCSPRGVLPPHIKKVVRKGYRSSSKVTNHLGSQTEQLQQEKGVDGDKGIESNKDPYLGYAILEYRDAEEANLVMVHMKDMKVMTDIVYPMSDHRQQSSRIANKSNQIAMEHSQLSDFVVKVRPTEHTKSKVGQNMKVADVSSESVAGLDPPILKQLQPLPMEELRRRYIRLSCEKNNDEKKSEYVKAWEEAATDYDRRDLVAGAYTTQYHPRRHVRFEGKLIPETLQTKLLGLLQTLRWPVENHRAGLSAERYLVLTTSSQSTEFDDLRQACRALMNWADKNYYYSGIAVTKNFVASPHIDDRDLSFQYAVALGDFTTGGELCVEGTIIAEKQHPISIGGDDGNDKETPQPSDFVNVVKTHNRIARVDGRHVHWVRTWTGGDRYSLIFYDTSDRCVTPILPDGVDLDYLEQTRG